VHNDTEAIIETACLPSMHLAGINPLSNTISRRRPACVTCFCSNERLSLAKLGAC
jgi:hypothetical protein